MFGKISYPYIYVWCSWITEAIKLKFDILVCNFICFNFVRSYRFPVQNVHLHQNSQMSKISNEIHFHIKNNEAMKTLPNWIKKACNIVKSKFAYKDLV